MKLGLVGHVLRDAVTTILDVLGLLLVAAGVFYGLAPTIGGWSWAAAGGVVLVGATVLEWQFDRQVSRE